MKTKIILVVILVLMNCLGILRNSTNTQKNAAKYRNDIFELQNLYPPIVISVQKEKNIAEDKKTNRKTQYEIMPDFAYGKWYMEEYMVDLFDSHDHDTDHMNRKRIKGYTRNYFSTENGGKARLIKEVRGAQRYQYVDCQWYVDGECVNMDSPANEFLFRMRNGTYKIEARKRDTTLISFTAVFPEMPEIVFKPTPSYDGEFGFDDNRYEAVAKLNNAEYLDMKYKYIVPFAGMQKNRTIDIDAHIVYMKDSYSEEDMKNATVKFESSSPGIKIGHGDEYGNYKEIQEYRLSDFEKSILSLKIKSEDIVGKGSVTARIGDNIVGKINLEIKDYLVPVNLTLVQVITNDRLGKYVDLEKQIPALDELLNKKSYNQAFVQWNVNKVVKTIKLNINKEKVKLLDIYKAAVKYYRDNNLNPENEFIMFISNSDFADDASGYANVSRNAINRYSIVRPDALKNKSAAHELGHNLGLKDLTVEHKSYFYDTDNFMDYYSTYNKDNRNMFWKYQWDDIYNRLYEEQQMKTLQANIGH